VRVAVIGCGSIGTRHAQNLVALGHYPVLFDHDYERLGRASVAVAQPNGVFGETRLWHPELLASSLPLDAALICTPASTHAAVARELLEIGYRGLLFVEKPLALSVDECQIFRRWPAPVMVGYNWRWNTEVRNFFEQLRNGARWIRLRCATRIADWPGQAYADPLLECSHELDLARAWDPTLRLRFVTGPLSWCGCVIDLESATNQVLIDLQWDAPAPHRHFSASLDTGEIVQFKPTPTAIDQSYIIELQAFLRTVDTGTPLGCTVDEAAAVLELVEAVRRRSAA
jgi:predicted dehydrogenase